MRKLLFLAAILFMFSNTTSAAATISLPSFAYVANAGNGSISVYAINGTTGALSEISGSPFADPVCGGPVGGSCPVWVTADPAGTFLYATESRLGMVSVFAIDPVSGGLTPVPGSAASVGGVDQSISIHPSGKFAYVTDIDSGNIFAFTVDSATGKLTTIAGPPFLTALGACCAVFHPNGQFLYVGTYTGLLFAFSLNTSTGVLTTLPGSPFQGGDTVQVHPSGSFLYVGGPTPGVGYSINSTTGALTLLPGASYINVGAIAIDPTGSFLYSTAGGAVSGVVYGYTINTSTGTLTPVPGSPFSSDTGASWTDIDPTGRFLYVSNEISQDITGYAINPPSGVLTALGSFPNGRGASAITTVQVAGISSGTITINANQPHATFSISPTIAGAPTGGPYPVTIPNVPAGTYTVTFNPLAGYTVQQPSPQTQTLSAGGTISFMGTYTAVPTTGTINVSTNLSGATFTITGPAMYSGGGTSFTQPNAPAGPYKITYNPVATYITPSPQTGTLLAGQTLPFTATYTPVTLSVCPTAPPGCPQSLAFSAQQGNGHQTAPQYLAISSNLSGLSFAATATTNPADGPWIAIGPANFGTTPATLTITVASNLKAGTYSGLITITSNAANNSPQNISVTLVVTQGPPPPLPTPGLVFPIKTDPSGCGGSCTPATANIVAIFDHQMTKPYESTPKLSNLTCSQAQTASATYGKIMDFQGEELDGPAAGGTATPSTDSYGRYGNLCGYRSTSTTPLLSGYNLKHRPYLYYDGHPGYDYPFSFATPVFPAISGCVTYTLDAGGSATQKDFHVMTIVPVAQKPKTCAHVSSETGYTVAYMHLSSFVGSDGTIQRCQNTNGSNCVSCPECAQEGEWVPTTRANPIGYVGNFAVSTATPKGWQGVGSHLHFEVDEWHANKPVPIDPYGWQPKTPNLKDPYVTLHPEVATQISLWNH